MLAAPSLFLPPKSAMRVLLLGVGGGAVIRQLQFLMDKPLVVGVDLDPVHIDVANNWFGVAQTNAELHLADARHFVAGTALSSAYDLIIDDLFYDEGGEPCRAVAADCSWSDQLFSLLNPDGVVVVNELSVRALRHSGFNRHPLVHSRYVCHLPQYENRIGVFVTGASGLKDWRAALHHHPRLGRAQKRDVSQIAIRRL